jgi:Zn-dependent oligopeptidase
MDFNSLKSVLASSKEKVDEMLAPVRIRQVRAKADLEISKLEEKLITTERKIVESVAKKDIDFAAVLKDMDEYDLTQRQISQMRQLVDGLFPVEAAKK